MCVTGRERDAVGVGAARLELQLAAVEGLVRGADHGNVDRLAVDGEQVRHAVARELAGVGAAGTPGIPISAMPIGRASGPAE